MHAGDDLYTRIVGAANDIYGSHRGSRALHSKGTWCEGAFTAEPAAARLSRAFHLSGEPITALVRFSNGGGKPDAHDAARDARGIAVKLRGAGAETDLLFTTTPSFATRTPEEFLELLSLRRPDPETGKPDMEKLGAWLGDHPEAGPAIEAVLAGEPLASFAEISYFSPHAFALVSAAGERTWVRWSLVPEAGERRLSDEEARARGRDHLHEEIAERLREAPVAFELRAQLAGEGDSLEDPTATWPSEREQLAAGRLEITATIEDPEHDGHIDVFDPNRLVDGVEPSADPVLRARHHAYSVSALKRLG